MATEKRRAQIQARIIELRDEIDQLISELEAETPPENKRPRFEIIKGGLGAAAIPALWLWRARPRPAAVVATTVAMGVTYSAVTAIAVPPSTHPGALPAAPYSLPHAALKAPTPSAPAAPSSPAPTTTPGTRAPAPRPAAPSTPGAPASPPASPLPAIAPALNIAPTLPVELTAIPAAPTPSPTGCLVTIGVTGVVSICAR